MLKQVNAVVSNANVRFYPEVTAMQIEMTLQMERGNAMIRVPVTTDEMFKMYKIFGTDNINALSGQYCRVTVDDLTGRIESIKNIIYDDGCVIYDNPII